MDRDRGFSFKLLVPPRVSHAHVSAVKPQEIHDTSMQQGFRKCFDKEQHISNNKSILASAKPNQRQDCVKMKVVPPMEKDKNHNTGQLYTKLFDEVEKIKCWKVKVDSDTVQKEKKLSENKRTIETQRKAIQELQFGNESLSVKLEEQISENEDLRNRNNATRNLCNILKDTFERSIEKMHLFECEREETHHLLLEYQEILQKHIETLEALHLKAEADQSELQKGKNTKDELIQFENQQKKLQQEIDMKEEEVETLQAKLRDNDRNLNNVFAELQDTKEHCRMLQEEIDHKSDLLRSSNAEHDSLIKKLHETEQAMTTLLAMTEEYEKIIRTKELNVQELTRETTHQKETFVQMQRSVDDLHKLLDSEKHKTTELEKQVNANIQELEKKKKDLGEMTELSAQKEKQINNLIEQLDATNKSMEAINSKMSVVTGRAEEMKAELLNKTEEAQQLKEVCHNAKRSLTELTTKFTLAQAQANELQKHLTNEQKKNEAKSSEVEQLQKEITQLKCTYEELLCNFNELQSVKYALELKLESQCLDTQTVEENIKMSEETAQELLNKMEQTKNEKHQLRHELNSIKTTLHHKCQEIEILKKNLEENGKNLLDEVSKKERRIRLIEAKSKLLKKQVAKQTAKSTELQDVINNLQEENHSLKRVHEEEHQILLEDQQNKSAVARELEIEVQKLRSETEEAIRCQEDTELKCQNKIADMVTLMEKHKSQYDRMVEEKDAELQVNKEKEMKAIAHGKILKQELLKQKKENDSLKKELKEHIKEKENLQKELFNLKNEKKNTQTPVESKQLPINGNKKEEESKTPMESLLKLYRFEFSKARKTPSSTKDECCAVAGKSASETTSVLTSCQTTPRSASFHSNNVKTPKSTASRSTSKIKSYRIRTPPSTEKQSAWVKGTIELDPKSDSSGQGDLLMFANTSAPIDSAPHANDNFFKSQSPLNLKSPKNNLKLAAMKRMRDAGWSAVTGNDKKKRTNEKIFA
ncbi:synaptonemal complex protein 1 [Periophthalmus magnuspinnatus]|uniref:synaptonemal complex protein 1 n=1 Tax=Periophthalmus magnuspinnatus TaxID=409849 RepID=UPI0024364A29|nr:synaptonemal complex protein 1 [Periophthalmus magnuspinnatus]